MDCPHCGEPTLAGAVACLSCRRPLFAFSPPARAEKPGGGGTAADAPAATLCRLCLGPVASGLSGRICAGCRGAPPPPAQSADEVLAEAVFRNRLGSKELRPAAEVRRRVRVHRGVWAGALGLICVLVSLGVTLFDREEDPVARHLYDVREEAAAWRVDVPADSVVRLLGELDVSVRRSYVQNNFSSDLSEDFDVRLQAEQRTDVGLADSPAGRLNVLAASRVLDKTGHKRRGELTDVPVYPWVERKGLGWYPLSANSPRGPDDTAAIAVRDVPPFLTLADTAAPSGELQPGRRWETSARLPFGAGERGTLSDLLFRCDVTYLGKSVRSGEACAVTRLEGVVDANPDGALRRYHRAHGRLRGALFHSLATGLLCEATLYVDTSVWKEGRSGVRDRIDVTGTLRVGRR